MPAGLRQAIAEGKKILVLINPPYAEATNADNAANSDNTSTKEGVAKTKFATLAMANYGKATNELFTQFVARIAIEIPSATLAMFSTLKYVNAPTLEILRNNWNAKYLGGFVLHSKAFEGLNGNFPIGFLVWATNQNAKKKEAITEIKTEVINKYVQPIGEKNFYNITGTKQLTDWVVRPATNNLNIVPLKNAVIPATASKDLRGTKWADGALAWLNCAGNDLQQAGTLTFLISSGFSSGRGCFITPENLWQSAIIFSVRRLIKPTWLNDRDQFLQPTEPLTDEFKTDCLIWMLFNGSNLTASANDLEWNNQTWSIVNHFIPFTEAEVNAPDRFESDFMVQYLAAIASNAKQSSLQKDVDCDITLAKTTELGCLDTLAITQDNGLPHRFATRNDDIENENGLSIEANAVLNAGRILWQAYFAHVDVRSTRDTFKLNRPDVGWYQVRNALKARNASGDYAPVDFNVFELAYKNLSDKLRPQVYTLGFLRA